MDAVLAAYLGPSLTRLCKSFTAAQRRCLARPGFDARYGRHYGCFKPTRSVVATKRAGKGVVALVYSDGTRERRDLAPWNDVNERLLRVSNVLADCGCEKQHATCDSRCVRKRLVRPTQAR